MMVLYKIIFEALSFFINGPFPASFSFILSPFQTNINTILQQINVKKCPSSIRHQDLNPRPSESESPPITTRPGLLPKEALSFWPVNENKHHRGLPSNLS